MKSFDTDLKKYAEKINLKASERRELRERIFSYMEYHPLPKQKGVEIQFAGVQGESFTVFRFNAWYTKVAGAVFAILLIFAPVVAERSLPGDVLYLIKTGLNEPFQAQFVNSPYEKIEFETKLMERRIAEARVLANEGTLTDEVRSQITADVKVHTSAVQSGLEELRAQDADGAALAEIAFNSSLEVQSAVLEENENSDNAALFENILTVVNEAREGVNQETTTLTYEILNAHVESETTRAMELFVSIQETATEKEKSDIERGLSDINRLIKRAQRQHEANPEAAVAKLSETLGLLQKLIVFMSDINVRQAVELESIVPVVPSDEDRLEFVKDEIEDMEDLYAEIEDRIQKATTSDQELADSKSVLVTELLESASEAVEEKNIDAAEVFANEASIHIGELDLLTASFDLIEPETAQEPEEVSSTTPTL